MVSMCDMSMLKAALTNSSCLSEAPLPVSAPSGMLQGMCYWLGMKASGGRAPHDGRLLRLPQGLLLKKDRTCAKGTWLFASMDWACYPWSVASNVDWPAPCNICGGRGFPSPLVGIDPGS